ncbi:protein-L-isoaspartate(D-aspartate) O-methyltransferase [Tautonia rosea]|uniref:protein-L-isoaspartate(D-aspartate) O-methyltransferase n=1 Tax=Tautonia rosea TaxID=2728037 RepID=UPI0014750347|nr:protein-L-isoaspartate(D-aspartate) O-methyltransferase [Tautonia rosea]
MPDRPDPLALDLVNHLRQRGISNANVLDAILRIPRDQFVTDSIRSNAWEDRALPISCDQTISQPFMVALMTQELALTGSEKVLEIGTGSGYQTAVLARLAREVFTVERHAALSSEARKRLEDQLRLKILRFRVGDGTVGWPEEAPFDRILVTAAAPNLPISLFEQLAEGGRIVLPIGSESQQQLQVIDRKNGKPVPFHSVPCRFVPLVGEHGWNERP